jgi:CheY-like chemotaxis protein
MVTMLDDRRLGYALGATDYMTKPIEPQRLLHVLHRLCPERNATILVVDDDEAVRDRLVPLIRDGGWRAVAAENGAVALERLAEARPDLILLDLMMPEMDGFAFLDALRERDDHRGTRVVVLTAKELTDEDRARLNGGVQRILAKDRTEGDDLVRHLRDALAAPREAEA